MNLATLKSTPSWEWPEETAQMLLDILHDEKAAESDRLLATELAGDSVVINEDLALVLLSIVANDHRSEEIRARAAISLGPVLEQASTDGYEDSDGAPITEETFGKIQDTLRKLYMDANVPMNVRRFVLEASVRAPQDWHQDAVRAAWLTNDESWKLTAVFCMGSIRGFDAEILKALESSKPDIHYEAVVAAGNWELDKAWPHIVELVTSKRTDKHLMLAAIDATASIRPHEAAEILGDLADSDDEDIVVAVHEAMAMVEAALDEDGQVDEDDEILN